MPLRIVALAALALVSLGHGSPTPFPAPSEVASASKSRTVQTDSSPAPRALRADSDPDRGGRPADVLAVASVTPWVDADGEFQVRFQPTTQLPPDARLTYTIHQSLVATERQSLRQKLLDIINGGSTGKVLQAPVTKNLSEYGDPASGAVLTIPVRSTSSADSTRAFLPNSGIHPIELVLTAADGPELWSQVVFLNRLPRVSRPGPGNGSTTNAAGSTRPVLVSLILPIQAPPAFTSDAKPDFSLESRFLLDATTQLLTETGDVPLRLGLRPDTFAGLSLTNEAWAQNLVSALGTATGTAPRGEDHGGDGDEKGSTTTLPGGSTEQKPESGAASLLRLPFVHFDLGGLAGSEKGNARQIVENQLALGSGVVSELTGSAEPSSTWVLDDTVTNESLPLIKSMGFTGVAVPASRIETNPEVDSERALTGPVRLDGPSRIRAIGYDDAISQQLADPSVDPAIRAHDAVATLMASWFTANRSRSDLSAPASLVIVSPTTDPDAVNALASALSGNGPLQRSSGADLLPPVSGRVDEPVTRLTSKPVAGDAGIVGKSLESTRLINAVDSMSQSAEPALSVWRYLNAETFSIGMSAQDRQSRHDAISEQVALKFGAIEMPPSRRVLLATRQTTIPLRFRNNLPYQVKLSMKARSPRVDVRSGASDEIVLEPGENRLDLPVDVRAPGESILRVDMSTPDGSAVLTSFKIPVSSRSISGVGSALSIISIVFLLLWWIHTLRKRRREAGRASSQHPAATGSPGAEDTVGQSD